MRVVLLVLVLLFMRSIVYADVTVLVDGKRLDMSPKPVIREGRVYVPVTSIRKLGLWVEWQPEKYETPI